MRVQAQREKREADNASLDKAAWIEHAAIGLMADALGRTQPAPMAEPPPPQSAPIPVEEAEPQPDPVAEAEQYAIIHPRRAALIRSQGGLTETVMAGHDPAIAPPPPEVVHAIVNGTSPNLRALDSPAEARAVAA